MTYEYETLSAVDQLAGLNAQIATEERAHFNEILRAGGKMPKKDIGNWRVIQDIEARIDVLKQQRSKFDKAAKAEAKALAKQNKESTSDAKRKDAQEDEGEPPISRPSDEAEAESEGGSDDEGSGSD